MWDDEAAHIFIPQGRRDGWTRQTRDGWGAITKYLTFHEKIQNLINIATHSFL